MPLDFRSATDLFLGREEELARALRLPADELQRHRSRPATAPPALLQALAQVLDERGRAMVRVAEMLIEAAAERGGNGRGGG
jgi:hypothetical protein